ncbi:MAG: hypothetical protein DSZ09_05690 [Sulfurovum sp.]|nr:MAG: hypothetical protein DSZ09_05690 [Sulfurovum sp.]
MKKIIDRILKNSYWTGIAGIATVVGTIWTIVSMNMTNNVSNQNELLKKIIVSTKTISHTPSRDQLLGIIGYLEIANSKFNEKRAREDLDMLLDNTKNTEAYSWKVKCEKLIDYQENYIFNIKRYKEKSAIEAIKTCSNARKLNLNNLYYFYLLAIAYHKNKEYDKSLDIIKSLAMRKYPLAQRKLGIMYYFGFLVRKNIKKSKEWILKAAQNGDITSQKIIDTKMFI